MKDPRIEQILNSNNRIAYEYQPVIPLASIDGKRSQHNQARIHEPIDRDLVRQYVQALRNGDQFPAIVVYEDNGKYVVIDGNHRFVAYDTDERGSIDAYVVVTTDALERTTLTYEMNTLNGRPSSEEDRDAHAVNLVLSGSMPASHVAERLHMSVKRVQTAVQDRQASDRANNLGAESLYKKILSKDLRVRISNALPLDKVFIHALRYQVSFPLGRNDLLELLRVITSHGTEAEQLAAIKNRIAAAEQRAAEEKALKGKRKNPQTKGRIGRFNDPALRLDAHLCYFVKNTDHEAVRGLLAPQREDLMKKIQAARVSLDLIESELSK